MAIQRSNAATTRGPNSGVVKHRCAAEAQVVLLLRSRGPGLQIAAERLGIPRLSHSRKRACRAGSGGG